MNTKNRYHHQHTVTPALTQSARKQRRVTEKPLLVSHYLHNLMTAMIEEVGNNLDGDGDDIYDHDDESSISEIFRTSSGLLDSLDKLTNEIQADLDEDSVTGSNESSSNDDEDLYWSDEDNHDSGENKLFSMMDELVNELMIELKDDAKNSKTVIDEENDESVVDKGEGIVVETKKDDYDQNATESDDDVQPSVVSVSSEDGLSSTSKLNSSQLLDDPVEEHAKLHQNVQTLLGQETELIDAMNAMKKAKAVEHVYNDKVSANIQRKIERGDFNADRLEHLMDAIATYSKFREAKINAIPTLSPPSQTCSTLQLKKKKRRKRTNKHKRRRSKSFVQTRESLLILSDSLIALDEKLSSERN